ncbi:MaoC family dehydratase [Streptomyces stelliscabiei]|uniref:MaoC family dehydratase n=1 Tax=Streptomyces stelliscabiei TaxID=146820 RepID=UPI0029B60AAE|nr:MaoC/PaaZ C-terminal domain-containing protein [Streptomyces stelliscabiei]MDX2556969.1 MaoC/PaaZ C-terminal domain-containing protein [Streptomyces stelliscabiei]MDX2615933.1 MaoC/PaaZ C-terminal domain-containing protein [Streptomyces stelliscabiei]MDX2640714.1 MaoC/PaaZ C-terminal domain-containing protein [Streptomyces stelliscabiei]MDX2664772.1 MaoC/PaaZ C-terminal domain-containing protein [Streptomyces stelliscabiei]MDX2715657.1 MaoC/PaaZ C-terminal domain-containing protein [Strepto
MQPTPTHTLAAPPALAPLLARGALGSPRKSRGLRGADFPPPPPGRFARLVLPGVRIDLARLAAYERVCGFPTGEDAVPLTYPHVLGFPLAMRIMSGRDFPLPLLGLVHTSIEITRRRRLPATGEYEITVYVEELAPHRRGTEATVVTEVRDGSEGEGEGGFGGGAGVAWESRSTYLARHGRGEGRRRAAAGGTGRAAAGGSGTASGDRSGPAQADGGGLEEADGSGTAQAGRSGTASGDRSGAASADRSGWASEGLQAVPGVAEWSLGGDVGRRYGAVSGDRNPIHLHPLGARLFGFPRAIAHGMWTVARCLAEYGTPPAALVRAEFRAPVPLPGTVTYAADAGTWGGFELRSGGVPGPDGEQVRPRVHVSGHVYPLVG